jgi:hypothetical protein
MKLLFRGHAVYSNVFVVLSISLRLAAITGGSFLAMISFLLMSCFYYAFSFALFTDVKFRGILKKESYAGITAIEIIASILAGLGIATLLIGVLYTILNTNGAMDYIINGAVICVIVLIFAVWKFWKGRELVYKRILQRMMFVVFVWAISSFV